MALVGLSQPMAALYAASGSTVTYSSGLVIGKATELDIELNSSDDNIFYADNGPAESDNQFSGGTISLSVDDISATNLATLLNLGNEAISNQAITTVGAAWKIYDDTQVIPFLGFGAVAKKIVGGTPYYIGIVLNKIKLNNPNDSLITQGESIEWRAPQLTGRIYKSDATGHGWRRVTTPLATEAEAVAAIKAFLSIT